MFNSLNVVFYRGLRTIPHVNNVHNNRQNNFKKISKNNAFNKKKHVKNKPKQQRNNNKKLQKTPNASVKKRMKIVRQEKYKKHNVKKKTV